MNAATITAIITADPSQFTAAMGSAQASANAAASSITASLGSVNATLRAVSAGVTGAAATAAASAATVNNVTNNITNNITIIQNRLAGLRSEINNVNSNLQQLGSGIRTFGLGMTVALSAPIGLLGKMGFEFNAMKEQALTAFTVLLRSSDLAVAHLKDLRTFSDATPFQFQEVFKASQIMQGFGLELGKVLPTLRALGDAISASGNSSEYLLLAAKAVGQMLSKGKVTAEEFTRQLGNTGVRLEHLALGLGKTQKETMELIRSGSLTAKEGVDALIKGIANSNVGGMMEKQSKTFLGALSTMTDVLKSTLGDLVEPLFNIIRDGMVASIPLLQQFSKWWQTVPEPIKLVALAIGAIVTVLGPLTVLIGGIVAAVGAIGAPILGYVAAITAGVTAAVGVITAVWITNFAGIRDNVIKVFDAIQGATEQIIGEVVQWYRANLPLIRSTTETVFGVVESLVRGTANIIRIIVTTTLNYIIPFIQARLRLLLTIFTVVMKAIHGDWKDAWQAIIDTAGSGIQALERKILSYLPPLFIVGHKLGMAVLGGLANALGNSGNPLAAVSTSLPLPNSGSTSLRLDPATLDAVKNSTGGSGGGGGIGGGRGGGGGGGGRSQDAAASLLARLREESAKLGIKTKEQEIALELLDGQYKKYNETIKQTILNAAREYDARKLVVEFQDKVTTTIDRQRDALRGELTELNKVQDLLRDPAAAQVIDRTTRSILLLNATLLDSEKLLKSAPKISDFNLAIPGLDFEEFPGVEAMEAQIKTTHDFTKAVEALNEKLKTKRALSNLEQTQLDITTGKLKELTQAQKDQLLTIAKGIDSQLQAKEKLDKLKEMAGQFTDIFKGAFDSLFTDGFEGFKAKLLSGFADLLSQLVSQLLQSAILKLIGGLFGGLLGGGFGGGGILAGLGSGGAGSATGGVFGGLFAAGGRPPVGRPSIVGERGPEIFVPDVAGLIVPNSGLSMAGGATIVNNFTISAPNGTISQASQRQMAARSGEAITRALNRNR